MVTISPRRPALSVTMDDDKLKALERPGCHQKRKSRPDGRLFSKTGNSRLPTYYIIASKTPKRNLPELLA